MNFMQATPRAQHKSNRFIWQAGAAMGLAALLVACGGGGDDAGAAPVAAPLPITRTEAVVGDYFVYAMTFTTSVPAGVAPRAYNLTTAYRSIALDGTNQRVSTRSDVAAVQQSTYNVNAALVSSDYFLGGAVICTFSPPAQASPPYPRAVGQAWSGTSVHNCAGPQTTMVQSGQIVARENLVTPAGTFDAYRTIRTALNTDTTSVTSQDLTYWYSVDRGFLLRCDHTNTTTPAGSTTPNNVISVTQILTGVGGPARPAQGNVLTRFQGLWRVQYTGGASGNCAQLFVSSSGTVSGNCTPAGGSAFAVTGTVNAGGEVSIVLPTGGVLTGTLTAPYAGTGTWVDGGLSGAWTAVHN